MFIHTITLVITLFQYIVQYLVIFSAVLNNLRLSVYFIVSDLYSDCFRGRLNVHCLGSYYSN
jgi:hypothetical protein